MALTAAGIARIGGAVLCWLAVLPASRASADQASCSFSPAAHTATITVTSGTGPAAWISIRSSDGALIVGSSAGSGPCAAATRNNLDSIVVNSVNAATTGSLFYVYPGVPFAPGFTDEPGSSDEIEMAFNLSSGGRWYLGLAAAGTATPLDLSLGGNAINLNRSEPDGIDADATVTGIAYVYLLGSTGPDVVTAGGGPGTPGPFTTPVIASSGPGADLLVGGSRADDLSGGLDPDRIFGGKGKDDLKGEDGIDRLFGQAGADKRLGGRAKDLVNGGAGRDRCTIKKDKHRNCELATPDKS